MAFRTCMSPPQSSNSNRGCSCMNRALAAAAAAHTSVCLLPPHLHQGCKGVCIRQQLLLQRDLCPRALLVVRGTGKGGGEGGGKSERNLSRKDTRKGGWMWQILGLGCVQGCGCGQCSCSDVHTVIWCNTAAGGFCHFNKLAA